ncbi:ferredoxin [Planctomycetales bacterium]|nr:ferredoxin [Planctomycetales bacterium]GHT07300.1 ferredoxin [Planctomycetales bacterium]GHV21762.1 ferredoxin [Planctomycetales bacterium]
MANITCKIDGIEVTVPDGTSVLDAAKKVGVKIPTLCYHPDLPAWASCGICVVKIQGSPKIVRACATPVEAGRGGAANNYITRDAELITTRRAVLELILSNHPNDCLRCARSGNCELQTLAADFGIREQPFEENFQHLPKDETTTSIVLNPEKCVKCGRCALVCQKLQGVYALEFIGRGETTRLAPAADVSLNESPCIKCGQCSAHCPVGAIYEKDETEKVFAALSNPKKHKVVQIAPAVRVAIGEAFGFKPGELQTGKLYAALRRLGFDKVFDTNFAADLTIMEEGTEFIHRFTKAPQELPLITSCCPAWVDYMEKYTHDLMSHFSTCKSPQQMEGAMIKTYYAEKSGIRAEDIFVLSVMPCTAKKFEVTEDDMRRGGLPDVDVAITTRELARMIKQAGIDFNALPDENVDPLLGTYSGAGTIFGVTGGVMEAALRTAVSKITGEKLPKVEFAETRGMDGVKTAKLNVGGNEVRIAVAHGMANIENVLNEIRAAKKEGKELPYHFVEVMACRGGCIGGGGQPQGATDEVRAQRTAGLYKDDEISRLRCSHDNPDVQAAYKEFLGEPNSHKAHELLHRHYQKRPVYSR